MLLQYPGGTLGQFQPNGMILVSSPDWQATRRGKIAINIFEQCVVNTNICLFTILVDLNTNPITAAVQKWAHCRKVHCCNQTALSKSPYICTVGKSQLLQFNNIEQVTIYLQSESPIRKVQHQHCTLMWALHLVCNLHSKLCGAQMHRIPLSET